MNKTQINTKLIENSSSVSNNLFCHENHFRIMNNNQNELIRARQQDKVLTSIKGKYTNLIRTSGINYTRLGHWNWIQIQNLARKITIITVY